MLARLLAAALLSAQPTVAQATFIAVPEGPPTAGGLSFSNLYGVSADGSVAVGSISDPVRTSLPIRWSPGSGTTLLPVPASSSTPSFASRISDDLGTIVGARGVNGTFLSAAPLLWSGSAAPIDLPTPTGAEYTLPVFLEPGGRFILGIDERLSTSFARQGLLWDRTGALVTAFPSSIRCASAASDGSFFFASQGSTNVRMHLDGSIQPVNVPVPPSYDSIVTVIGNGDGTVVGGIANEFAVRDDVFLFDETAQTFQFAPGLPGSGRKPHRISLLTPGLELAVVSFPLPMQSVGLWIPTLGTADLVTYAQELGADLGPFAAPGALVTPTAISDDGTCIVGIAVEGNRRQGWMLRFPADWWTVVGSTFCDPATINSTGHPSRTMAFGSDEVAASALRLETHGLPPGVFGVYAVSPNTGNVTPPGSAGPLCLGGAIGRFDRGGQLLAASPAGRVRLEVDLAALPGPSGPRTAQPGESWHFQFWHRDASAGTSSNFSNAVTVVAR